MKETRPYPYLLQLSRTPGREVEGEVVRGGRGEGGAVLSV